jgi:hypothetical protein
MRNETLLLLVLAGLAAAQPTTNSYVGAGGCASSNCHGATSALPEEQSRILGNEYATWSAIDKHSNAYKALSDPRSKRMADILKLNVLIDKRCTACHVVGSPEKSLSDGVACEACHGPASNWLGSHLQVKSKSPADMASTHADSVQKGMIDTKKLDVRAKMCMACHLGQGSQMVDHEMIAAGHPDLAFELDTFTVAQPAHHREPKPAPGNALPRVRAWAVGQSMALAEGMRLLASHGLNRWPEFSDLECYQCHHDLRADSWRIQRGYDDRRPGSLRVNLARFDVLRELVGIAAPDQAAALDRGIRRLGNALSVRVTDGAAIAQAAMEVEQVADLLTARFLSQNFDASNTAALIQALRTDIDRIAGDGVNSAEQATLSLDALASALPPQSSAVQKAITALYDYLEHPSLYTPADFVALYKSATESK